MTEHDPSMHAHTEQEISGPGAVGIGRDNNGVVITGASLDYREALRLCLRGIAGLQFQEMDRLLNVLLEFPATEVILYRQRIAVSSTVYLVETIHNPDVEDAYQRMQVLEDTLDRCVVRAPGLQQAHLRELFHLLQRANISIEHIKNGYGLLGLDSACCRMPGVAGEQEILAAVIEQLSTYPVQVPDDTHPLLEFVSLFLTVPALKHLPGIQAERDQLMHWLSTVARAMQIPAPLHRAYQPAPHDSGAVLLIRVATDLPVRKDLRPVRNATFRLNAWIGTAQMFVDGHPSPVCDTYTCSLDTMHEHIGAIIGQAGSDYSHLNIDAVEVILPWYLLLHTIDQCEVEKGIFSQSIAGAEHHTVVRLLERIHPPRLRQRLRASWETRWQTYQEWQRYNRSEQLRRQVRPIDPADTQCALARLGSADAHHKTIQKVLHQPQIFGLVHAFVLKELMTPHNAMHVLVESLVDMNRVVVEKIVDMGIPIALCMRGSADNHLQLLNAVEQVLTEHTITELSGVIQAYRNDAFDALDAGNPDHPGLHLTLLWDDPTRLPPDLQLFQDQEL